MPADELCPDDFRDIREALVVQDSVNVFPALLVELLIGLNYLGLVIFILKFLHPQAYTVNASFLRTFGN